MIQNFISKLSPQEKKIAYIAIVALVLAILDRVFFGPVMSQLKSLDEQIEQEKNTAKRDLRFLSYKDKIIKEDEAFHVYYDQKFQAEEEIIAAFLKKVEVLASEAKLNLVKVSPAESVAQKGFIEYYANLECHGPLENFVKFMYAIDASAEMLRITKFSVTPKRASEQDVQAAMTVVKIIINPPSNEEIEEINKIIRKPKDEDQSEDTLAKEEKQPAGDEPKPSIWQRFMNKGQTLQEPTESP